MGMVGPIEELADILRRRIRDDVDFAHTLLFDFGAEGAIFIDATRRPVEVVAERRPAEASFGLSTGLFRELLGGRNPTLAYMSGKLRVSGSKGVALKVAELLKG